MGHHEETGELSKDETTGVLHPLGWEVLHPWEGGPWQVPERLEQ